MKSIVYLFSIILLYGCTSSSHQEPSLSQDEYEVMEAVIKDYFVNYLDPFTHSKLDSLYVYHKTIYSRNSDDDNYARWTGAISKKDTTVSLKRLSTSGEWDSLDSNFIAISHDTIDIDLTKLSLPNTKFLVSQYNKLPNLTKILICFSRVGFNNKMNEAIMCFRLKKIEHEESFYLLLKKENNQWSVVNGIGYVGIIGNKIFYKSWRKWSVAP